MLQLVRLPYGPVHTSSIGHGYEYIQGRYAGVLMVADGDLAVSPAALEGPDIWIDTQLWDAFFISQALGKALRKAKVDQGFLLRTCRVVDA